MGCGSEITECMGAVLARDFCRAVAGEIPWTAVRELCAKCNGTFDHMAGIEGEIEQSPLLKGLVTGQVPP